MRAGRRMRRELDATVPVRTGELQRSARYRTYERGDTAFVEVTYLADHAIFVAEGTRPHVIVPRRPGGVLRFPGRGGQIVFARRVNHPGTDPNPWWDDALERWPEFVADALVEVSA